MIKQTLLILFISMALYGAKGHAKGIYLEPKEFLLDVFGDVITPKTIWINKALKTEIKAILGHELDVIRLRYWDDGQKTAWILEEIGYAKPITVGIVVKEQTIQRVNVLIFRESRGWEVKYPFFTDQYRQAALTENNELNKKIDGISGATLSVNALNRLARLALFLDRQIKK